MEVTKENFDQILKEVQIAISEADFIAIDTEFTGTLCTLIYNKFFNQGLNSTSFTTGPSILDFLDTSQERYDRLRNGATPEFNYLILQYGICTFKWIDEEKK